MGGAGCPPLVPSESPVSAGQIPGGAICQGLFREQPCFHLDVLFQLLFSPKLRLMNIFACYQRGQYIISNFGV